MTPPPTAPATSCRNCGQAVPAAAATCVFCGVAQQGSATSFVVAPGTLAPTPTASPTAATAASTAASTTTATATALATGVPQSRLSQPSFAPRGTANLGPAFRGNAAGTAMRVAAFSLDVGVVVAAVVVTLVASGSAILAGLVTLDLIVLLWVLEGRTGLTLGNAILRIRTSRDDAPFSPGVGRSFVRHIITGMGFLAAAVGAWVVVASSAWDPHRRGRGWADRAARTVTVAVARRERVAPAPVVAALPRAVEAYSVGRNEPQVSGGGLAAPQAGRSRGRGSTSLEHSESVSHTGVTVVSSSDAVAVTPAQAPPQAPAVKIAPAPGTLAPDDAGAAAHAHESLLLVFDTGQRETLRLPAVANLGRKPSATDPGDQLISVTDSEGTVSKTHLRLEHSRGRTWVSDLGSTNGSELIEDDGEVTRLVPRERTAVQDGSRVRVGNRTFTVSVFLDAADQAGESRS